MPSTQYLFYRRILRKLSRNSEGNHGQGERSFEFNMKASRSRSECPGYDFSWRKPKLDAKNKKFMGDIELTKS